MSPNTMNMMSIKNSIIFIISSWNIGHITDEGFVDFILEIFELSGISNVGNCYQQIKFSKYQKQRIIEEIRQTVHANTESTILHTNQSFFKRIYICTFKF